MASGALQQLLHQQQLLWWAFYFVLLFSVGIWFLIRRPSNKRGRRPLEAFPSPPGLPILGNLHQIGPLAHRSLRALSERHGAVLLVRFGSVPTVVVSSAAAAEEVLKTRDLSFANRPTMSIPTRLLYDSRDMAFAKYGEYWRELRRVCALHLLSNRRVESFRPVREEELAIMLGQIRRTTGAVNLSELIITYTSDVICRVTFGKKYSTEAGDGGTWFRHVLPEFMVLLAAFPMRDYIPMLGLVDWLSSLEGRIKKNSTELDGFIEKILDDHTRKNSTNKTSAAAGASAFIDILESLEKEDATGGFRLSRESVKAILLDMFAAGTDTTSTLMVWTMAEIIKHPKEMKRLQEEVRRVVGPKAEVREEMAKRMEYLQAAIKETMRLHPPGALLVPREAMNGARVQGYDVPAGTRVIVNAWAIGRDPESWPVDPEEWRPDRFLGSSIDFKGTDFRLIPFGAGRRGCPGIAFALASVDILLASLLYHFDWELPDGKKGETLDMSETFGLTVRKKTSLVLVAKPVS